MTDNERYEAAAHAMQTGVALEIEHGISDASNPKHLRVGVNSAMVDTAGLAGLLISKGLITREEYVKAIADQMEAEAASYEQRIQARLGVNIRLY
jgi:fructose/tagatose bisphosphate aldolase